MIKQKPAIVERDEYGECWLVVVRDLKQREIFTIAYSTKHGAQQAASLLNRSKWIVAA